MSNTEWKKVKLGDLCTFKTGKLNANAAVENGEYAFFTCSRETFKTDRYSFDGEALLIAGNGDVGFTKYYVGKFDAYQRTYVLMNFSVDAKYIYFYLQKYLPARIEAEMIGSAVPYIKLGTLSDMEIQVPESVEEQRRIASLLSRFDELIQLHEFKAENLIKAKQQIMSDILSGGLRELESINPDDYVQDNWVTVKLGDIFTFVNGKAFKPSDWFEDGLPIIRIQNLTGNPEYNRFSGYIADKYKIYNEDMILSWSGTIDIFRWTGENAVLNQHLFKVHCKSNIDNCMGYYILQSCIPGLRNLSHGAVMKHIKKGDVDG